MEQKNNKRRYLWIYAGILFLSALVVLLLTGLSQMKLVGNDEEYKIKLKDHEKSIKDFNISLTSAAEQNKVLEKEIELLKKENESLKSITAQAKTSSLNSKKTKESYENILNAEKFLEKGQIVLCAQSIKKVIVDTLGEQAQKRYSYLKRNSYLHTMKYFYYKAKGEYTKKKYSQAKEAFLESLSFDEAKYFEENTLYYLAAISKKQNDLNGFNDYSKRLKENYPKSDYNSKL